MSHLEDLLAQWWRDSYPNANLNNQTAAMMVAFAAYVLQHQPTTPNTNG